MKYILLILLILMIFIISIAFSAHNDQIVTINYLLARNQFRLSTLLILLFISGFVIGWIICGLFYLRNYIKLIRIKRRVKQLEKQFALAKTSKLYSPIAHKE